MVRIWLGNMRIMLRTMTNVEVLHNTWMCFHTTLATWIWVVCKMEHYFGSMSMYVLLLCTIQSLNCWRHGKLSMLLLQEPPHRLQHLFDVDNMHSNNTNKIFWCTCSACLHPIGTLVGMIHVGGPRPYALSFRGNWTPLWIFVTKSWSTS